MVETAADATYQKGQLYQLNLSDLNPDPNQPRKSMESQALEELTASVKTYGIIQPLLFRVDPNSAHPEPVEGQTLFIVAGERRFEAAKIAGIATIPAIFVGGNTSEIALMENLLRQDLTAIEEAEALQRLKDEQKYTDEQLGAIIGKARTTLNETLSLNKLPQEIRDECRADRTITKSTPHHDRPKKAGPGHDNGLQRLQGQTTQRQDDPAEDGGDPWRNYRLGDQNHHQTPNSKLKTINSKLFRLDRGRPNQLPNSPHQPKNRNRDLSILTSQITPGHCEAHVRRGNLMYGGSKLIDDIVWLDSIVDKLAWKHNVMTSEVEDVLAGRCRIFKK